MSSALTPNSTRCGTAIISAVAPIHIITLEAWSVIDRNSDVISLVPYKSDRRVRFANGTTGTTPKLWRIVATRCHDLC